MGCGVLFQGVELIGVKLERKEELRHGRWGAVKLCADRCGQTLDKAH